MFFIPFSQTIAFSDIETSFHKQAIWELEEQKLVSGYEDGSFKPRETISREEILKLIFQLSESEVDTEQTGCFGDVNSDMWSEKYICSWNTLEIVKGFEDGTFRPFEKVTFLEALAFSARAFELDIPEDDSEEWFEKYRDFMDEKNIFPKHSYTRDTFINRWQAAELLLALKKYKQAETLSLDSIWCNMNDTPSDSGTLEVAGKTRKYIFSLPSGYTPSNSYPLVFGIHGRTNSNAMVQDYMKLERYPEGAIVVYPAGLGAGPFNWAESENIDYFDALVSKITENYCVKRDKIFVVGHSLWGYMTYKLGCLRGDIIRAISVVWGASYAGKCEYPVATQILHRPDDHLVSYNQGEQMLRQFQKVNLCTSETQKQEFGNISQTQYSCSWENPVVFGNDFATYANDPHSWPKWGSSFAFDFFESLK